MSGEFFPGNNEPINNEPKPMAPENMAPADTPEAPTSETPTEFVIPEAAAAEIGATAIDAVAETEPVAEPVEASAEPVNEFTNFTGEQEAAPVNREELENSVVEKVEKDPKKKKILVGVGVAILALSVGVGGIIAGINGKKNHGDNKPTEPTRNTIETTETGDITTTETDAPVITVTEETPTTETTETPTETTETPTETAETEQSGEVNPDDFWETDASGRRIFHQDEYLDALGYTMMGYNAIYFFDNNSGSITYEGGGDFFTYTPPSSSPDEFPETFVGGHISDGEEVVREFCGLETKTHESSVDDFINAAEAFTHYRETQEVPNGYE